MGVKIAVYRLRLLPLQSLPETQTQKSAQAHLGDSGKTQAHAYGDVEARP